MQTLKPLMVVLVLAALGAPCMGADEPAAPVESAKPATPAPTPKKSLTGDDPVAEQAAGEAGAASDKPAFMGVGLTRASQTVSQQIGLPRGVGLAIASVVEDSAAAKGGLVVGDVLHMIDEQLIITPDQFAVLISLHKAGERVKLTYYHEGKKRTINLELGARPERQERAEGQGGAQGQPAWQGLRLADDAKLTDEQRAQMRQAMERAKAQLAERGIELNGDAGDLIFEGGPGVQLHRLRIVPGAGGENVERREIKDADGNVVGEVIVIEAEAEGTIEEAVPAPGE